MARIELNLPECNLFSTELPVRIRDINYGQHLSNDALLGLLHETRVQWLRSLGFNSELDVGGAGLIMADVAMTFKHEAFYADVLRISLGVAEISRASFDLYYDVRHRAQTVAQGKTAMLAYDYQQKKICSLPAPLRAALEQQGTSS
jgi:acyl-CoA thioester hydrolase